MSIRIRRRDLLRGAVFGAAAALLPPSASPLSREFEFEISLTERSLARSIAKQTVKHLDLARIAKQELGISAVEYASEFFRDKVQDDKYLESMNVQAADHGVRQLLIMIDGEGSIGAPDTNQQKQAVQNHRKWIDAAKALGCHSIQIDPTSTGSADQQRERLVPALGELCEYAATQKMNVLLGNYGGVSANSSWVAAAVEAVNRPCCGTLPQVGKLATNQDYENLVPLIPFAKGITAVAFDFDSEGEEINTDYLRAMKIVQQSGYRGYIGIHFAGMEIDELSGIRATKRALEKIRGAMQKN